jgi:hypothetical protein
MKPTSFSAFFSRSIALGCIAFLASTWTTSADEPTDLPRIQIALLTPSDFEPPPGHRERLTEIANYTEAFFAHWMKHWKYPPARTKIFDRESNGQVVVRHVRGKHPAGSGQYDKPTLMTEVYNTAIPQYKIPRHFHVWWVHVYLGPTREYADYRGSGNASQGGSAVVRYSNLPGAIDPEGEILEGFHEKYHLKGIIHELGHAFGLPHLGPRKGDRFGNTLMGPNQFEWNRVAKQPEPRGYLSEAAAAMLWKHPLFSGSTEKRRQMPKVNVDRVDCQFDRSAKRIRVRGHIESDIDPHSVVVVDESTAAPSEYWRKGYVARVGNDGTFQVDVTEVAPADGALRIVFCFDNGVVTGNGKEFGLESATPAPYRYRNRSISFPTQGGQVRPASALHLPYQRGRRVEFQRLEAADSAAFRCNRAHNAILGAEAQGAM